jgi:hypothetical protein
LHVPDSPLHIAVKKAGEKPVDVDQFSLLLTMGCRAADADSGRPAEKEKADNNIWSIGLCMEGDWMARLGDSRPKGNKDKAVTVNVQ